MSEPPITVRERLWAGGLVFLVVFLLILAFGFMFPEIERGSTLDRMAPAFTMSFVGLVVAAVNKPRPVLRWVKRWAPDWLQLP